MKPKAALAERSYYFVFSCLAGKKKEREIILEE